MGGCPECHSFDINIAVWFRIFTFEKCNKCNHKWRFRQITPAGLTIDISPTNIKALLLHDKRLELGFYNNS